MTSFVAGSIYNANAGSKYELLSTCFQVPLGDMRSLMLAHNHMMLVARAFLTRAKWDLPPNEEKKINNCDEHGELSIIAVVASAQGRELAELLQEGVICEYLYYKIDEEETDAASTISQALNKAHEVAPRMT